MSQTNTTQTMIRTRTKTLEEVDKAKEVPATEVAAITVTITETRNLQNMHLQKKMKDSLISKLLITKTGHRPIQLKHITDTLPLLCADKNFQGLNEVIWTERDLVEADFMLIYMNTAQWSTIHHVQITTVNPNNAVDRVTGKRLVCFQMMEQTHAFDTNL